MPLQNFAEDNIITANGENINDLLHTLQKKAEQAIDCFNVT